MPRMASPSFRSSSRAFDVAAVTDGTIMVVGSFTGTVAFDLGDTGEDLVGAEKDLFIGRFR